GTTNAHPKPQSFVRAASHGYDFFQGETAQQNAHHRLPLQQTQHHTDSYPPLGAGSQRPHNSCAQSKSGPDLECHATSGAATDESPHSSPYGGLLNAAPPHTVLGQKHVLGLIAGLSRPPHHFLHCSQIKLACPHKCLKKAGRCSLHGSLPATHAAPYAPCSHLWHRPQATPPDPHRESLADPW